MKFVIAEYEYKFVGQTFYRANVPSIDIQNFKNFLEMEMNIYRKPYHLIANSMKNNLAFHNFINFFRSKNSNSELSWEHLFLLQ